MEKAVGTTPRDTPLTIEGSVAHSGGSAPAETFIRILFVRKIKGHTWNIDWEADGVISAYHLKAGNTYNPSEVVEQLDDHCFHLADDVSDGWEYGSKYYARVKGASLTI